MDPGVQGLAGAVMALAFLRAKEKPLTVAAIGLGAGLLADIDILIKSDNDPLLFLEYHRHFTHALAFIPIAAGLITILLGPFLKRQFSYSRLYFLSFMAYATHGLIDACTSYGTQLLWPFSNQRVAWNNVAIVDPVVTAILLIALIFTLIKKQARPAKIGLLCLALYLALGFIQQDRAKSHILQIAAQRGHNIERLEAKPTVFNNFLFRTIYQSGNTYFVDAVRVGWFSKPKLFEGANINVLNIENDFPDLPKNSTQYNDIKRFDWFSDGYLVLHPYEPKVIGDLRFSMVPDALEPLWGIKINSDQPDKHVEYLFFRQVTADRWERFKRMLFG